MLLAMLQSTWNENHQRFADVVLRFPLFGSNSDAGVVVLARQKRGQMKGMLLAVGMLLCAGMAHAVPCGPVTMGKVYTKHDDGAGPNFRIQVNGQWYNDGQLATVPTNNFWAGATEVYGFLDVYSPSFYSGCVVPPVPWTWDLITNVVIADWSETCSGNFPTCYQGHPVNWYTQFGSSTLQTCHDPYSCQFDLTDSRAFDWNSWVVGHSYRIYAFAIADVETQGDSCNPVGQGCIPDPINNDAYWAFVGVYVQ